MISWLVKIVVGIAVVGFLVMELGSPIVARIQLDNTANDAAQAAATDYFTHHDADAARRTAADVARKEDAGVEEFTIDGSTVRLRLTKEAHSFVLKKLKQAERWYHVTAKASAVAQP